MANPKKENASIYISQKPFIIQGITDTYLKILAFSLLSEVREAQKFPLEPSGPSGPPAVRIVYYALAPQLEELHIRLVPF